MGWVVGDTTSCGTCVDPGMREFCSGMGLRGSAGGTGIGLRSCVVMPSPTFISTSKADASQQNELRYKKKRRITAMLSAALPITLLAQYSIKYNIKNLTAWAT